VVGVNLVPIICPQCGAKVKIMQGENTAKCSHCATELFIDKNEIVHVLKEDTEGKWKKALVLAERYVKVGVYDKAYAHATELIETKPDDMRGWYYKALACDALMDIVNNKLVGLVPKDAAGYIQSNQLAEKANAYAREWSASATEAIRLAKENPNDPFTKTISEYVKKKEKKP